jgi:hypothetical protein
MRCRGGVKSRLCKFRVMKVSQREPTSQKLWYTGMWYCIVGWYQCYMGTCSFNLQCQDVCTRSLQSNSESIQWTACNHLLHDYNLYSTATQNPELWSLANQMQNVAQMDVHITSYQVKTRSDHTDPKLYAHIHQYLNWMFKLQFPLHFEPKAAVSSPMLYNHTLVQLQARG